MAGTASKDGTSGDGSSPSEGSLVAQNCQAQENLVEWRSCEQVDNDTPSTSPPYWDTDDDEDNGPKPSELYGKFTWKIESFSQISKRELRSNAFEVGGYKWYILIYPQGCDVCNHLSLFLCVANHDRLLPGWSHFAQFTIAVVNKDPKKSKYSDTLHRFWKKEHDWGWKKFMELSKIVDGFIDADTLVIKAQVQVIREKSNRPFRCLDRQYRRELVRVYLSNVENICRRFVEERRGMLSKLIEDRVSWSGFRTFWLGIDQNARRRMSRDKTDAILKVVVKHFFVEKEVTSTLVMDSLYSGLKALEWQSESKKGANKFAEVEEMPSPIVDVENGIFILADDALVLLERTALEPLPPKDDKGAQSQSQSQNQNRTKDGSSSEEFSKDSVERDEKRLTELGRRTLEIFILTHIFSSKIEVAYQEVVAFQRQEELIREEEAAGQAEIELRAKRLAAEKEKRAKKKQSKQKRSNRKGKDRNVPPRPDLVSTDISLRSDSHIEKILEDFSAEYETTMPEKVEILDVSDVSDTGGEVGETAEPGLDDRVPSPRISETDALEVTPVAEASSSEIQHDQLEKKGRTAIDDSSSTCSNDSAPCAVSNVGNRTNSSQNNSDPLPLSRGRTRRNKAARRRTSETNLDAITIPSDDIGRPQDTVDHSRTSTPEREAVLQSNGPEKNPRPDVLDKKEHVPSVQNTSVQNNTHAKALPDQGTQLLSKKSDSSSFSPISLKGALSSSQQPKHSFEVPTESASSARESTTSAARLVEKSANVMLKPRQSIHTEKPEISRVPTPGMLAVANEVAPLSRPLSAPLIPDAKPSTLAVSSVQTQPFLSRSVSAFGRLGATEPSSSSHSYAPLSYRNAIIGKSTAWSSPSVYAPDPSLSSKESLFSQSPATAATTAFPDPVLPRPEQVLIRPGYNFSPVNSKASSTCPAAGRLMHDFGHHMPLSRVTNAFVPYSEEPAPGAAVRPAQSIGTDEFPHLDIINYLLEEDQTDTKMSMNGHSCSLPSWQYAFPGNLSTEAGSANSSTRFNGPDQYYSDTSSMYSPYHHLDGGRVLLLDGDSPIYTSGEMEGAWMYGQWPMGAAGSSADLSAGSSSECSPHPYQLQDYSNLACGVNGYTMYPPTNGF